jgi:hypothetical protein
LPDAVLAEISNSKEMISTKNDERHIKSQQSKRSLQTTIQVVQGFLFIGRDELPHPASMWTVIAQD